IWTTTLWDYRKALVEEFGQERAADIAALSVTDAMPRSPVDPSFIDMRNAIALAIDDRYHDSADYETIVDIFWSTFAGRGLGLNAQSDGGDDLDPVPAFDHIDAAQNGTLSGQVVNASTGEPVADAKVILGVFEGRVSPLRKTGESGGFSAPVVAGSYPVTVQARGFGSHTFDAVEVTQGETTSLRFEVSPNLASEANGAKVVSSTSPNARALFDDTSASTWRSTPRGHVVVELAKRAKVDAIQVSAFTTSRFEALKDLTFQVSNDGLLWRNAVVRDDAFGYQTPRPVAPDLSYKTFLLAKPTDARFIRFYTDAPMGETKTAVQAAELQVFSGRAKNVSPLPPPPPDEPFVEEGTIAGGNPTGDNTGGGVTGLEFSSECVYPPASQGLDGWVTKLPETFGDGLHQVRAEGTGPAHDLDLYFYDAQCRPTGSAASSSADESGTLPSGTAYV
ncbi:MAG: carboxypeptidase regulatory-like domain-containing protein, partial [Nocardioidaceae bacterium]